MSDAQGSSSLPAAGDSAGVPLEIARAGDAMDAAALAPLRDLLNAQIGELNQALDQATDQSDIDRILALQARLASQAMALGVASIALLTGEAKITAAHLRSAVDSAQAVIDKVATTKARLALLGSVIDFAAAVLTGDGKVIVGAAGKLKTALQQQE